MNRFVGLSETSPTWASQKEPHDSWGSGEFHLGEQPFENFK